MQVHSLGQSKMETVSSVIADNSDQYDCRMLSLAALHTTWSPTCTAAPSQQAPESGTDRSVQRCHTMGCDTTQRMTAESVVAYSKNPESLF